MTNPASPQTIANTAPAVSTIFRVTVSDIYRGFVAASHHGAVLVGLVLTALVLTLTFRADLREDAEQRLLGWLLQRQEGPLAATSLPAQENDPGNSVQAVPQALLPKAQAAVTQWLSRRYRVAHEPLGVLVAEAFSVGEKAQLDPTLILAVMAIESRFNPYAQSPVGAQGLMQVLTRVHSDKYASYGGQHAAFDPLSNLRVGAKVLKDCIRQAGSVEGGLRLYVGAVTTDGSGYINKVMTEHLRIQSVALGKPMPTTFPIFTAAPVPVPVEPVLVETTQTGLLETSAEPTPTVAPVDSPDVTTTTSSS